MWILLFAAAAASLVLVAAYGVTLVVDRPVESRFQELQLRREMRPDDRPNVVTSLVDRVGQPLVPAIVSTLGEERRRGWDRKLDAAGRPDGLTPEGLAARKGGFALLLGAIGIAFIGMFGWWAPVALLTFGFVLPDLSLSSTLKERQDAIDRSLPDFLDVLAVTVSAGLDFRAALDRVSAAFDGPLSDEVRMALQQMMLGQPRREALEALQRRNRSESLSEFVSALQQAEDLGAPLQSALNDIALDVRRTYAQQARREASKVEPRLSVLLTITLIPGAMIIIAVGAYISSGVDFSALLGGG